MLNPVEPIETVPLFLPLSAALHSALSGLSAADWAKPTVCGPWTVKDVAAHLLGGNLGRLWRQREVPTAIASMPYDDLLARINQSNDEWVRAARRISPEILIEFLASTDQHLYEYFKSLDGHAPARIGVAWAGQAESRNWFDIAREYTEKWLHQQHIREAVGLPALTDRRWLFPVLDTFVRALPHTYRGITADEGAAVVLQISGAAGGAWSMLHQVGQWQLFAGEADAGYRLISRVEMDQDLAWRVFTKGVDLAEARSRVHIEGDQASGMQVLHMVSIMA